MRCDLKVLNLEVMKTLMILACLAATTGDLLGNDPPETVVVTYRPKAGKEKEVEGLIQKHWETIQRLGMVLPEPHLLYRGQDAKGSTFFVNIITWKTHEAPDAAPAEVTAIWRAMEESV